MIAPTVATGVSFIVVGHLEHPGFRLFLAAMSSSRSDYVSKCVCVCLWGVNLFSLEHSNHLKLDVSNVFQGCILGSLLCVLRVFQGCFKDVLRVF